MIVLAALALAQVVPPHTQQLATQTIDDARPPVSLWIGNDDALSFGFGNALGRSLAASAAARPASPVSAAEYRLVVRQLPRPRGSTQRFAYAVDLFRPVPERRERVIETVHGHCTPTTLDACAATVMARISRRLGG